MPHLAWIGALVLALRQAPHLIHKVFHGKLRQLAAILSTVQRILPPTQNRNN